MPLRLPGRPGRKTAEADTLRPVDPRDREILALRKALDTLEDEFKRLAAGQNRLSLRQDVVEQTVHQALRMQAEEVTQVKAQLTRDSLANRRGLQDASAASEHNRSMMGRVLAAFADLERKYG